LRSNREFSAVMNQYPCDRLHLEVRFDPGTAPSAGEIGFEVWFGEARMPHAGEHRRIQEANGFRYDSRSGQSGTAILEVAYPIAELRYAITWDPRG